MASHRRVKDLGHELDDDDLGDYEDYGEEAAEPESEALSPEDQKQMDDGTKAVREALGPDFSASTAEIQEALWHYYYDVDKSVSYLKKQREPVTPKKQKQPSKFDQAAQAAQSKAHATGEELHSPQKPRGSSVTACSSGYNEYGSLHSKQQGTGSQSCSRDASAFSSAARIWSCSRPLTAAQYFRDVAWLKIPESRQGNIAVQPSCFGRGLLGGSAAGASGKTSKLAALAAQRRKAQEEKKRQEQEASQPAKALEPRESEPSSMLDNLHISDRSSKFQPITSSQVPEMKSNKRQIPGPQESQARKYPRSIPLDRSPSRTGKTVPETQLQIDPVSPEAPTVDARAQPSAFAMTMFGPNHPSRVTEDSPFRLHYPQDEKADSNPFKGPSPDDVVQKAQSKGKSAKTASQPKSAEKKKADGLENDVAALKINEASRVKSKNLNISEEYEKSNIKDSASFVVVGHVDHGKSTLMGRLLQDLQIINTRAVGKLQKSATEAGKSSFGYAWVLDSTAEERARGVTMDIATNSFTTPARGQRFTILDAPGHRDFIPNMIAGAAQADFAVLVIDASTNAFEAGLKGQTKEHALLIRSMGIARLIIAINKMDSAGWSKERFEEIKQQMTAFLTTTGFNAANLAFIPCAGLTGANVAVPLAENVAPWYRDAADDTKPGPTLVDALDASSPTQRKISEPFRMTISDVFKGAVTSPVSISGRLDSGSIQVGEQILCQPSGESALVRGIELDDGEPVDWVVAGQIATLHLLDIDPIHIRSGDIACSTARPLKNAKQLTIKLLAFEHIMPGFTEAHKGRMHVAARITQLAAILNKSTGRVEKKRPRVVQPGALARVSLELDKEMPLEAGVRLVLRNEGQTIGAGLVEAAA